MADSKVSEMFAQASEKFKGLIDANSVIGEPYRADDDTVIIPISKLSFGFGFGGSDMEFKNNSTDTRFGGAMGGGASVKAEAFLVISNGNVRVIPMNADATPVDKIIDMMPSAMDKINGFLASRSEKKAAKKAEKASVDVAGDI